MTKQVLLATFLGVIVLLIYMILVNGIFGMQARIDMKQLAAEREVYSLLQQHVTKPGRYIVNPELTQENMFPLNKPVYSILYSGMGHEAAGRTMLYGLLFYFVALLIASTLTSLSAESVKRSYPRKVLVFILIGALIAFYSDLNKFGIGNYTLADAALLAIMDILAWTAVGLAVAWIFKPPRAIKLKR